MKYYTTLFLFILSNTINGQDPFAKQLTFFPGDFELQEARRIIRTPDNKFLVVGYTALNGNPLDREAIAFKMDGEGNVEWAKSYGDGAFSTGNNDKPSFEEFYDVVQVGSYYYCVGYTRNSDWVHGTYEFFLRTPLDIGSSGNLIGDVFLVKLKLDGTLVWAKTMGKPVNGVDETDGNDIGLRLVASGQGGVIVVARINAGASTNQNNGLIWVDADGKTKWANQYDLATDSSNNELTFSIWKDDAQSYITGGWIRSFDSLDLTGGMLFKINQDGNLIWDRNTRCTPGVFESQYYGYYNHNTKKIYSTDYYSQVSGSVREIQVCTNRANSGNAPAVGAIPQAMRYHYGAPGSSSNNFRSLIFPVGDGYQQFILAANDLNLPTANSTKYTTLISVDEDLNFEWSKKVGAPNQDAIGYLNQVYDMITCDVESQNFSDRGTNNSFIPGDPTFLAVGTITKSNSNKAILITRIGGDEDLVNCEAEAAVSDTSLSETTDTINLTKINLNAVNCDTACWADDTFISGVVVTDLSATLSDAECAPEERGSLRDTVNELEHNHIIPNITDEPLGLSFIFQETPKQLYFEITDITGDFVYERFYGNLDKLIAGFDFSSVKYPIGDYIWSIEAVYDDGLGGERKTGEFRKE